MKNTVHGLTWQAMLLAAGVILAAVEAIYLPSFLVPGAKIGLANSMALLVIVYFGLKETLTHIALRVLVVSLITGTFLSTTFLYSLCGGVGSALVMYTAYKYLRTRLSFAGISILGALTHNMAQLSLAAVVIGHGAVIAFLPWLLFMAVLSGISTGTLINIIEPRLADVVILP